MGTGEVPVVQRLGEHLQVNREKYAACIDVLDSPLGIEGIDAKLRMHFVKFDSNGRPKFADLAKCLVDHILQYCHSARRLQSRAAPDEWVRLVRETRDLFTKRLSSGEPGEVLLYFLVECVLEAPQVVAKITLKTSPKMEVHGADGIHMKWDENDGVLDVYFGEAKLHQSLGSAVQSAVQSISRFHEEDMSSRELELVTSNFKLADLDLKEAISRYLDRQDGSAPGCRVKHACLIGYDWEEYQRLDGIERGRLLEEFRSRYAADGPRLRDALAGGFMGLRDLRVILEVFFLPFKSVQEFREAFNRALTGT